MGSSGTNVLKFVMDDLHTCNEVQAYFAYADSLEKSVGHRLPVGHTNWEDSPHRTIDVELGSYPAGLMFERIVTVRWVFNDEDRLTDIIVERQTIGP
jgi:hypothetical protein